MRYKFEFNDWDLRELDSILIQPKKDGNGYTVHKTMKPEPGDGWDEWKSSLAASFEKAQENKKAIEELKSNLNRTLENKNTDEEHQKEVAAVRNELLWAKDARDHWLKQYMQTCKKLEDIQAELAERDNRIEKLQNNCKHLEEKVDDLQSELEEKDKQITEAKEQNEYLEKWLREYKTRNRSWQQRYNEMLCRQTRLFQKPEFVGYSFAIDTDEFKNNSQHALDALKNAEEMINSKEKGPSEIDNGDPYEKFKVEFPELDISEVDFSDHQTLNNVFKKCFSVKREQNPYKQKDFLNFIKEFEHGANIFENLKHFDLHWLFLLFYGNSPTWLSNNRKELERYQWNKEHPFKYSINTVFDPETHITEYYVVFNSAPEYRD